jgi:ATP-dependent helicase HrpB
MAYGQVVLDESRGPAPAGPDTSLVLAEAALAAGLERFVPGDGLSRLRARMVLAAQHFPDAGLPSLGDEDLRSALAAACEGLRSFAELMEAGLLELLLARLSGEQRSLLQRELPERIQLPGGRGVPVHYEMGKPPWIESRLQDFFGMSRGPSVCAGRVPLTVHLLAPNHRAVQVTQDLEGFWKRHYPSIRKELARRYPRHPWPEDGASAQPPAPRR